MKCATCKTVDCFTSGKDCTGRKDELAALYADDEQAQAIMRTAAELLTEGSMHMPRVQEIIAFGKKMDMKKMGIAFCAALHREAKLLSELLAPHFEIVSACCKICGIPKEEFNLPKLPDHNPDIICNPLGQADILNGARTEMNLVVGLCLGHDMLFTRHSAAPATTVIVKDRVLANNPAGALYSPYWVRLIKENRKIGKGASEHDK